MYILTFFVILICLMFVGEIIISFIQNVRLGKQYTILEKELRKKHGPRIKCMECKYCKKFRYKVFYNYPGFDQYLPSYCYKFRIKLKADPQIVCKSYNPEFAERKSL